MGRWHGVKVWSSLWGSHLLVLVVVVVVVVVVDVDVDVVVVVVCGVGGGVLLVDFNERCCKQIDL